MFYRKLALCALSVAVVSICFASAPASVSADEVRASVIPAVQYSSGGNSATLVQPVRHYGWGGGYGGYGGGGRGGFGLSFGYGYPSYYGGYYRPYYSTPYYGGWGGYNSYGYYPRYNYGGGGYGYGYPSYGYGNCW